MEGTKGTEQSLNALGRGLNFNSSINLAGDDIEKLDLIITGLESITYSLNENSKPTNTDDSSHRAVKFVSTVPHDEILVSESEY